MPSRFEIKQRDDRLRVDLYGALDEPTARELEGALLAAAEPLAPGSFVVLVSLMGATSCALEARPVLARMQKALAPRARRTVYVDERPFMRGMALWVMHLAGDGNAKAVATQEQAELWLRGSEDRVMGARLRTAGA